MNLNSSTYSPYGQTKTPSLIWLLIYFATKGMHYLHLYFSDLVESTHSIHSVVTTPPNQGRPSEKDFQNSTSVLQFTHFLFWCKAFERDWEKCCFSIYLKVVKRNMYRGSYPEVFCEKVVLKNFAKITVNHLYWRTLLEDATGGQLYRRTLL